MCGSRKFIRGAPGNVFLVINVYHRGLVCMDHPREAIGTDPSGPIAYQEGSVPEVLRKSLVTCGFPGEVQNPCPLLDLPM